MYENFTNLPFISSYAITRLKQAPDDDLVLYLLQLVQALKYENFDDIEVITDKNNDRHFVSLLQMGI